MVIGEKSGKLSTK